MEKILIQNAFVLDPASGRSGLSDLLVEDQWVTAMENHLPVPQGARVECIDVKGALVTPGFIDLQVNPGLGIEHICRDLLSCGVTTPLIMPCNVHGKTYLDYYGGLDGVLKAVEGRHTNVATAISIQPADTELHETYKQLRVPVGGVAARVEELRQKGITAIGEVVLPLAGTAHVLSDLSEPFLDELLDATSLCQYPVLLHTGLGTDGFLEAIRIANGRGLHLCHVGSTVAGGDLHRVLSAIEASPNITCDTHLAPMAGGNSRKSDLLRHYFEQGEAYHIDPATLEATPLTDLEVDSPPFYYSKENLLENNIICALSRAVDAIESDDLGEGVRSKLMVHNLLALLKTANTASARTKLMLRLFEKMTIRPAQILQLDRRGSISPGNYADIVIFDADTAGVDTVLVNGKPALRGKAATGIQAGKHLARRP